MMTELEEILKLKKENESLKEEVEMLRDLVSAYEILYNTQRKKIDELERKLKEVI